MLVAEGSTIMNKLSHLRCVLLTAILASLSIMVLIFGTSCCWNFDQYQYPRYIRYHQTSPSKPPLVARHDGAGYTFKILQFTDLHFTGDPTYQCKDTPHGMKASDCTEALTTKFMNEMLDVEQPDMVVFTGDNVQTVKASMHKVAMDYATNPVEERGIPWAMVFGNHDEEKCFKREKQFHLAASKKHSYIQRGPARVDGVGNYELSVISGSDSRTLLRMYLLDSHANSIPFISKYDWIKQNQIDFYRQLSDSHRKDLVPALMFFHIPIPEFEPRLGDVISGEKYEGVASPSVKNKLLATLAEQQEVKALFVGHDHGNDYCIKRQGIQLCYGGGAGFGIALGTSHRARVIEWKQDGNGSRIIRSWRRLYESLDQIRTLETLYEDRGVIVPEQNISSLSSNKKAVSGLLVVAISVVWLGR